MSDTDYKASIFDGLAKFSLLFENPPEPERLRAYCEYLESYSAQEIVSALDTIAKSEHKFPSLAKIIDTIDGTKDEQAQDQVANIIYSVSRYGQYDTSSAKEFLGPIGWSMVQAFGGWQTLCKLESKQMGIARAQLRDTYRMVSNKIEKAKQIETASMGNKKVQTIITKCLEGKSMEAK